jgi:hypothetical protein
MNEQVSAFGGKKSFYSLVFAFIIVAGGLLGARAAQAATLAVSPTSGSVAVGNTISVSIVLDTQGAAAYGVDVYSLHFNSAYLQVSTVTPGSLLPITAYNTFNNTTGVIQFSQVSSTGGNNFTGTGTLATILFQATAAGSSSLTFDYTAGSTNQCDVAGLYTNLLSSVTNGSVTVSSSADTTPPTVPTNLSATSSSASTASLTWTASTDPVVGGQTTSGLAGYQIFRCSGSSCSPTVQVGTSTIASFSDSGLSASTVYGYAVKAYDNAGNISAASTAAYVTTGVNPPVISNIVVSGIGQTSATVTWTTNTNSNSQVDYGLTTSYGSASTLNGTLTTSHSVALSGLSAGTTYHYQVRSQDSSGNLSVSPDNTFTTQLAPDTTPPTAGITAPSAGSVSGTITYSATASDPTVAGQVTSGLFSLTLYVDGSVFATTSSGSITASLDTTTLSNATHTLTAVAKDNAGNIGSSSPVSITVFNLGSATRYPRLLTLSSLEDLSAIPASLSATISVISPTLGTTLESYTLTPNGSNQYSVGFLSSDPQVVNLRVKVNGYLSQLVTGLDTTVNSGAVTSVSELNAGDLNNDNTINALDYSIMNTHWLQNYPIADINADGIVNSLDFAVLKNNFNKSGN